jgi:predicted small lipoprotein YifL
MHLLIAAAAAGILLGCGQKGPLVLPDAQHPHKKIGVGKPSAAPATSAPSGGAPSSGAAPSSSSAPSSSISPSSDKLPPRDAPGAVPQP